MSEVTLYDLVPPARHEPDDALFVQYRIEESVDGLTWSPIEAAAALFPAMTDPGKPSTYAFTSANAGADAVYFRVVWIDANAGEVATPPMIRPYPLPAWTPSLGDVASFIISRTKMPNGQYANTFNEKTKPTNSQVEMFIVKAVEDVVPLTGRIISDPDEANTARNLAAMRAAMLVELNLFSGDVARGDSPYPQYLEMWESETGSGEDENTGGGSLLEVNTPSFSFPVYSSLVDWRMAHECRAPGTDCRGECML